MMKPQNAARVAIRGSTTAIDSTVLSHAALTRVKGGGDPAPPNGDAPPGSTGSSGSGTGH